jgi:hypothetical protein
MSHRVRFERLEDIVARDLCYFKVLPPGRARDLEDIVDKAIPILIVAATS